MSELLIHVAKRYDPQIMTILSLVLVRKCEITITHSIKNIGLKNAVKGRNDRDVERMNSKLTLYTWGLLTVVLQDHLFVLRNTKYFKICYWGVWVTDSENVICRKPNTVNATWSLHLISDLPNQKKIKKIPSFNSWCLLIFSIYIYIYIFSIQYI